MVQDFFHQPYYNVLFKSTQVSKLNDWMKIHQGKKNKLAFEVRLSGGCPRFVVVDVHTPTLVSGNLWTLVTVKKKT